MTAMIPFRPFADMLSSYDRRFNAVFDAGSWIGFPRVDLKDAPDHLALIAEVPGMTPENVEVTVDGDVLTISARGDEQKSETKDGYVWRERRRQSLRRAFRLPQGTGADQVEATLENGLLTVTVQKAQAPAPARIAIKSGKADAAPSEVAVETPAAS
ncbi:MAG: Hsp20/alpha crystallin family protein [Candidatus Dormibacteraceae bacterium]